MRFPDLLQRQRVAYRKFPAPGIRTLNPANDQVRTGGRMYNDGLPALDMAGGMDQMPTRVGRGEERGGGRTIQCLGDRIQCRRRRDRVSAPAPEPGRVSKVR